ncbi:MAG: UPF0175 family protein [Candidatus Firestonebacteria bacterium]|nr:UPF0175 family protein [Candidatus Firestonebacteria bacterium]
MKTDTLNINISQDIFATLKIEGYTKEKLEKNAKQNLAINLFFEGILSFGKAAELADMDKWQFMDLLRDKKVPFINPDKEEILEEYKIACKITKGKNYENNK